MADTPVVDTPEGDASTAPADPISFADTDTASTPVVPPELASQVQPSAIASEPLPPIDFSANTEKPVVPVDDAPVSSKRVAAINASPVGAIIDQEAAALGYKDADKLKAIISIESSGNPGIMTGSYKGLGQLSDAEFAKYGDGGDIFDARANVRATIRSLQDKEAKFEKEFGKTPSATELYLMHQQGEAGLRSHLAHPDWPAWLSMLNTGEGRQKGEGWAKAAIWGNVPEDVRDQYGSVNNITSADFVRVWDARLHGGSAGPTPTNFAQQIAPSDINQKPAPSEAAIMAASEAAADYSDTHGIVTESLAQSNLTAKMITSLGDKFAPDPNFELTPELQKDLTTRYNLTQDSAAALGNAVSAPHAEFLAQQAQETQQREQFLASYGIGGVAAQLGASLIDPVALAAGAATGGLADWGAAVAGGGRALRVAAQAAGGAVAGAGLNAFDANLTGRDATDGLAMSIATGAIFGAAYGRLARNPETAAEAVQLSKAGQTLKRSLEDSTALTPAGSTVGAARNPNVVDPFLNDPAAAALQDTQVPKTYSKLFGVVPIRFSAAGIAKSSKNALTRLVAGIGLDGVGWADHSVNEFSAAEEGELLLRQHMMSLHQVWEPAAEEWAHEQGLGIGGKVFGGAKFNDEVYRAVTNRDPNVEFSEPVKRVAQRISQLNAEVLRMAKNPGERQGLISRAVQGFEEVKENPNYMMRVYASEKLNALREGEQGIGDEGIRNWFKGAIRKAQPDLGDDEIDKLAKWHVKRITERANGIDERMNLALSGFDREQLKDVFREAGIEDDRIEKLLGGVNENSQPGADTRAKRRLLLDEGYVLRDYPTMGSGKRDVSLSDMAVTDASLLSHIYWKHMFGRIALANFKVRNPAIKAPALPRDLTVKVMNSKDLRPDAPSNAQEVHLVDKAGTVHYRAELSHEKGQMTGIGFAENLTRKYKGLGPALYGELAKVAEAQNSRLIVGINSTKAAKAVHSELERLGMAKAITGDELGLPDLNGRDIFHVSSQPDNMIVNGITSDNEWLSLKNRIARWAGDNLPGDEAKAQTESDHAQLDYMYDRILGRSDKDATGDAAKWLQRFADASYIRLGGNFGMAQLPELIAPVAHLGIKAALSNMPAFRRLLKLNEVAVEDHLSALDRAGFRTDGYHGTTAVFDKFDPAMMGENTGAASAKRGFFFAKNADTAEAYTGKVHATYGDLPPGIKERVDAINAKIEETYTDPSLEKQSALNELSKRREQLISERGALYDEASKHLYSEGSNIRPVRLKMENPYEYDFKGADFRERPYNQIIKEAQEKGHDSVILRNTKDGGPLDDIYVVFSPDQIRSKFDAPSAMMQKESVLLDEVARDVEAMWGLGADHFKGFQYFRHENTGDGVRVSNNAIDNALGFGKQAVSHLSGLHIVNATLQRWTGKAILGRFAEMAAKAVDGTSGAIDLAAIGEKQLNRMRYLGLGDDMLKRVLKQVRDNFETQDGMLFGKKVTRLNLDQWNDQEARAALENAGFRWARNVVQENDIGTMHRWMAKPLARMLMQFRVFPLVAWDKQLLHNIHMADMTSFNLMWMTMVSGAATYALQTQISSLGRSDRDAYLQKRMTPQNLALGGFQRAGWSAMLPTLYDTGAYMVGGHPAFDFRLSGQATDMLFGNPVMSTIDDIAKMSQGIVRPITNGRERTQAEYRNMARVAPLATWLPATTLLSTMIGSHPLAPPVSEQK